MMKLRRDMLPWLLMAGCVGASQNAPAPALPTAGGALGHVVDASDVDAADVVQTIAVEGMQWTWQYRFEGEVRSDELWLRPGLVRLDFTTRDVAHRFVVAGLDMDVAVSPGDTTTVFVNVTTQGQAQTGPDASCRDGDTDCMVTVVWVMDAQQQARKIAQQLGPLLDEGESWSTYGETVFAEMGCSVCHTMNDGVNVGPSLNGIADTQRPLADGTTVLADAAYLHRAIVEPNAEIVAGFQSQQPSYAGQLTDNQLRGLIAYLQCHGAAPPGPPDCLNSAGR